MSIGNSPLLLSSTLVARPLTMLCRRRRRDPPLNQFKQSDASMTFLILLFNRTKKGLRTLLCSRLSWSKENVFVCFFLLLLPRLPRMLLISRLSSSFSVVMETQKCQSSLELQTLLESHFLMKDRFFFSFFFFPFHKYWEKNILNPSLPDFKDILFGYAAVYVVISFTMLRSIFQHGKKTTERVGLESIYGYL